MENDQLISDLQIHGIVHLNRYANPAKGFVKNGGTLPFITDYHPCFWIVRREPSPTMALR
jgi:hypothetical protein